MKNNLIARKSASALGVAAAALLLGACEKPLDTDEQAASARSSAQQVAGLTPVSSRTVTGAGTVNPFADEAVVLTPGITLGVDAGYLTGGVQQVQFFIGTYPLPATFNASTAIPFFIGASTAPPYRFTWRGFPSSLNPLNVTRASVYEVNAVVVGANGSRTVVPASLINPDNSFMRLSNADIFIPNTAAAGASDKNSSLDETLVQTIRLNGSIVELPGGPKTPAKVQLAGGTAQQTFTKAGDFVEFTAAAPAGAGQYTLSFFYDNLGATKGPVQVTVNGQVVGASISTPTFAGYQREQFESTQQPPYATVEVRARLNSGSNTIRITALGSTGPNITGLRLAGVPVQPVVIPRVGVIEAEAGELQGNATVKTSTTSTPSGGKYVNLTGGAIEFTVSVPLAGKYQLLNRQWIAGNGSIRYTTIFSANNGPSVTAEYNNDVYFKTASIELDLQTGVNRIRIQPGNFTRVGSATDIPEWRLDFIAVAPAIRQAKPPVAQ